MAHPHQSNEEKRSFLAAGRHVVDKEVEHRRKFLAHRAVHGEYGARCLPPLSCLYPPHRFETLIASARRWQLIRRDPVL